ncbi:MAG: polymer-forming cytoskeletal protein [Desulfobacterales bacterium]|jgi:cytoskeletal protein CcmA (bactofilin family)
MLKKGKKSDDEKSVAYNNVTEQKPPTTVPHPETKAEQTVIGENISIEGNIRGDEHLVIEGSMKGNVEMEKHNFTVGSKGRVEGEINAQNVKVSGQMIGNIKTQGKVEITKEADFIGDIRTKSISVEDGAYFKGSIELDKEPHRKTILSGKSTTGTTAQPESKPETQMAKKEAKEI